MVPALVERVETTHQAYGFRFPTASAARRYRALVLLLECANVNTNARIRMGSRFIDANGGVWAGVP